MAFVAPGKTSRSQVRHPDSGLIRQWARPSRRFTARTHLDRGISSESQVQAAVFRVWLSWIHSSQGGKEVNERLERLY